MHEGKECWSSHAEASRNGPKHGHVAVNIFVAFGCSTGNGQDAAPTAQEVHDRYVASRGGSQALNAMAAVERMGWISVSGGSDGLLAGAYHTCIRYPDRVAIEIDAGPWQVAEALRAAEAVECLKWTASDGRLRTGTSWPRCRVTPPRAREWRRPAVVQK
jgi:hypothetical protein